MMDDSPFSKNPTITPLSPDSFNAAYRTLQRNAENLRHQTEPDIDGLAPLIEESLRAYAICKQRLETVRRALEEQLGPEPHSDGEENVAINDVVSR